MNVAPHTLRRTITAKESKQHEIFVLRSKISNCKEQIDFFTEILNNPKASIEMQRKMLFKIEGEELTMLKIKEELNKLI